LIATAESFCGQDRAIRLLTRSIEKGRLAGAILLLGERGLGKTTLATIIARALTCEERAKDPARFPGLAFCGGCYACRTIAAGEQSEYVIVRPAGADIKVEQLDEKSGALYAASLHPVNMSHRIFIIDEAHCLNVQTANQLLKLLEEPPERTVFMLITDKPAMLLPTIHSRGLKVQLTPEPPERLAAMLAHDLPGVALETLSEAAHIGAGRYVDAAGLAENAAWRASIAALAGAIGGARGIRHRAEAAAELEFQALWQKELRDKGLDEAGAEKMMASKQLKDDPPQTLTRQRRNELHRQALIAAYDRALLALLRQGPPPRALAVAYHKLTARINQNVDPALAQEAFELELTG
jgi:hypothetical protein